MGTLRRTVIAAFGFAAMMVAAVGGAHAQTSTSLVYGGNIVDNGWTISLTSFTYTISMGGTQTSSCSVSNSGTSCTNGDSLSILANDVLESVNNGRNVSFVLANKTTGNSVVTFTNNTSGIEEVDINYTVAMTPVASKSMPLTTVSAAIQGTISGDSTPYTLSGSFGNYSSGMSDGLTVTADGAVQPGLQSNSLGQVGPVTFAATTSEVDVKQDLRLFTSPGQTLTLTNNPTNAPEPATISIFAPAVLAMVKARKSRKRKTYSPR